MNNDGGGIFSFLPIAGSTPRFEALFGTPHGTDLSAAAALGDARFTRAETPASSPPRSRTPAVRGSASSRRGSSTAPPTSRFTRRSERPWPVRSRRAAHEPARPRVLGRRFAPAADPRIHREPRAPGTTCGRCSVRASASSRRTCRVTARALSRRTPPSTVRWSSCSRCSTRTGLERVDVAGYSLGARVALGLGLRAPERVGRLVLESGSPGLRRRRERGERRRDDAALAEVIERDGLEAFVRRWEALPLFDGLRRLPEELRTRPPRAAALAPPGGAGRLAPRAVPGRPAELLGAAVDAARAVAAAHRGPRPEVHRHRPGHGGGDAAGLGPRLPRRGARATSGVASRNGPAR